jgi:hypothetical protein
MKLRSGRGFTLEELKVNSLIWMIGYERKKRVC